MQYVTSLGLIFRSGGTSAHPRGDEGPRSTFSFQLGCEEHLDIRILFEQALTVSMSKKIYSGPRFPLSLSSKLESFKTAVNCTSFVLKITWLCGHNTRILHIDF